ncbi:MAG: AAA family ATPase [Fimbriimonas sp.]|nr:AAA family ATPase [Fimbriimonas sp.]
MVETLEHRRFVEFCDACRRYRYIGLCFGAPGVGKTLSARHYSRFEAVKDSDRRTACIAEGAPPDTVFYTPSVVNTPRTIDLAIRRSRDSIRNLAKRPLRLEMEEKLNAIRLRDENYKSEILRKHDWFSRPVPELRPTYGEVARAYSIKEMEIADPTALILVDEADRLRMASLEQVRAIFDAGNIGMILVGMPGIEKRLARYPQFYSRIGFVHEFRPLAANEIRDLLEKGWVPPGVNLPERPLDPETIAAIIRMTAGNFRLLNRLLTQIERILEVNSLQEVTKAAVEAARESLVIGEA